MLFSKTNTNLLHPYIRSYILEGCLTLCMYGHINKQHGFNMTTSTMMAESEIDSFYRKFKNLLHSERDATLTIKSVVGKAVVTLSLDLGHFLSAGPHPPHRPRDGPSRQRRRARRKDTRHEAATKTAELTVAVIEKETAAVEEESAMDAKTVQVKASTNAAEEL